MSLWKSVKNIRRNYLVTLFFMFLKHPLFGIATFWATILTFKISEEKFPRIHGKHNKANAFRHCFWNLLIAKKCAYFSKNENSVLSWTKRFTDLHEELNPNKLLAREMDLKNNELGRLWYLILKTSTTEEIINYLFLKLNKAEKVDTVLAIKESKELVYLEQ